MSVSLKMNSNANTSVIATDTANRPRDLSTVQFPYVDFDQAASVAEAIHSLGGHATKDQIAAKMGHKLTGAFSSKLSAARMFGLITLNQGQFKVSRLGYEILDGDEIRRRAAKVTSFLNIELYRKLHDEFRGQPLPPRPGGLEAAIERIGVVPKQKTDARYAFDRSAKQCGFFEYGNDRLVAPVVPEHIEPEAVDDLKNAESNTDSRIGSKSLTENLDGVIAALVAKLPRGPEAKMNAAERNAWLKMMSMAFDMAYGVSSSVNEISQASVPLPMPRREKNFDLDDEIPF